MVGQLPNFDKAQILAKISKLIRDLQKIDFKNITQINPIPQIHTKLSDLDIPKDNKSTPSIKEKKHTGC